MLDTHCHLFDNQFVDDQKQIVNNFLSAGVDCAICIGCEDVGNKKSKELAKTYDCIYYTVGYHPDDLAEYDLKLLETYLQANDKKLVAVGEIGLDYFHNKDNKEVQKQAFIEQIELANKYKLPIVIHCREAFGDTLEILKNHPANYGAVMHCYSGSWQFAQQLLKLGVKFSFTGTVTYKNAVNVQEVAKNLPIDTFFFETDSPYLSPVPFRGTRNEPQNVVEIAKFVANLRDMSYDEIVKITDKNAKLFFKIEF